MGPQLLYSSMAGEFLQIRFLHLFLISTTLDFDSMKVSFGCLHLDLRYEGFWKI
ncbi:unnamed protein product [Prunus brigantina]